MATKRTPARAAAKPTSTKGPRFYCGCAGWNIPSDQREHFPEEGSHLERYASVFPAVEINSSFYKPHRPVTYARWADSVPPAFRFSVKAPKEITHRLKLRGVNGPLDAFLGEVASLGKKLGCLLFQMPPGLAFEPDTVESFLAALRRRHAGAVVAEPRHASWFTPPAQRMLAAFRVGRVAADPAPVPEAAEPGGWSGIAYYRLHGSPEMYYSSYSKASLRQLATRLAAPAMRAEELWCIFDNTARGAATANALDFMQMSQLKGPATASA